MYGASLGQRTSELTILFVRQVSRSATQDVKHLAWMGGSHCLRLTNLLSYVINRSGIARSPRMRVRQQPIDHRAKELPVGATRTFRGEALDLSGILEGLLHMPRLQGRMPPARYSTVAAQEAH